MTKSTKIPNTFIKDGLLYGRFYRKKEGGYSEKKVLFGAADDKKALALAWERVTAYKLGTYDPFSAQDAPQERTTLAETISYFLSAKKDTVKESTYMDYVYRLEQFAEQIGPHSYIHSLSQRQVNTYRPKAKHKGHLSEGSIDSYQRDVNTFLHWANKNEYTDKWLTIERKGVQSAKRWLTEQELKGMLKQFQGSDENKLWFLVAFYSGLRRQEQYELRSHQIQFKDGQAILHIGFQDVGNEYKTKTKRGRYVFIEPEYSYIFERIKKQGTDLAFPNRCKDPKSYSKTFKRMIQKYMPEKANFEYRCLRKSYGYMLLTKGYDLYHVQKMLGHANISTTEKWYVDHMDLIERYMQQQDEHSQQEKVSPIQVRVEGIKKAAFRRKPPYIGG